MTFTQKQCDSSKDLVNLEEDKVGLGEGKEKTAHPALFSSFLKIQITPGS